MHEVVAVEEADFGHRLAFSHHAGAGYRLYRNRVLGKRFQMTIETAKPGVIRHQPMKLKNLAKDPPRIGDIAPRAALLAAIGIDQPGPGDPGTSLVQDRVAHGGQGARQQPTIRVQQQHQVAAAGLQSDIARLSETDIAVERDNFEIQASAIVGLDLGEAGIGRIIVDHHDLDRVVADILGYHAVERRAQKRPGVEIHDHDRDKHRIARCFIQFGFAFG